jgi:hypothetical protein
MIAAGCCGFNRCLTRRRRRAVAQWLTFGVTLSPESGAAIAAWRESMAEIATGIYAYPNSFIFFWIKADRIP